MAEAPDHEWIVFQLLHKLSPRRFEELCMALLEAEEHTGVRHLGAAGADLGVDILSTAPDGRVWATQCKRYRSLSAKDVRKDDLQNAIDFPANPAPSVYRG